MRIQIACLLRLSMGNPISRPCLRTRLPHQLLSRSHPARRSACILQHAARVTGVPGWLKSGRPLSMLSTRCAVEVTHARHGCVSDEQSACRLPFQSMHCRMHSYARGRETAKTGEKLVMGVSMVNICVLATKLERAKRVVSAHC